MTTTINAKAINKTVRAILRGEDKTEATRLKFFENHIRPLMGKDGRIDWLSGNGAETRAVIKAATVSWYVSIPRVIDGTLYQCDALKAIFAPKATKGAVHKAANKAVNLKVWRYTGGLVDDYAPAGGNSAQSDGSRAPHRKVETAKTHSMARAKGRAAKAKAKAETAAPQSVPALSALLCDAIAKLKPQSRVAAANQVMDEMRNIIKVARHAMETAPRKVAKPPKAVKVDAAVAIQ